MLLTARGQELHGLWTVRFRDVLSIDLLQMILLTFLREIGTGSCLNVARHLVVHAETIVHAGSGDGEISDAAWLQIDCYGLSGLGVITGEVC